MTHTATTSAVQPSLAAIKHAIAPSPEIALDTKTVRPRAPFGTLLGTYEGIEVFSCKGRGNFQSHYHDGFFTGVRWQCVELARRYLLVRHGVTFESINFAYEIFNQTTRFASVESRALVAVRRHTNGSHVRPVKGSLLIWDHGGINTYTGHVAVVVNVQDTYVDIIEQNMDDTVWPATENFSRRLAVTSNAQGHFTIEKYHRNETILGWVTLEKLHE
ncbi:bifunctional glutathionylspermidine amidase/glutathionylspermidine synthetase [Achlya hypogyna]|uniref:Bifunctional glutathionylspermidine amidase/glutathionylspermidine synthetase n=1 Tax=Achlya hypogyna TaxID=1202772 RepID=A0A1V9YP89_ACHHY|nr:bifunctional glutathionylspermidine amidase/glutathionylspermidine synthetase [Achlya hypogyna]